MSLMLIYQKPNNIGSANAHETYLYLLKELRVTRPNQVWVAYITYIPMRWGFLYFVAIIDWYTHRILGWRISNTLVAGFCARALNEAIPE
ncbi:MAG: DDE-type integrase/transposase/recombinase [Pseudomonadota bacterium]